MTCPIPEMLAIYKNYPEFVNASIIISSTHRVCEFIITFLCICPMTHITTTRELTLWYYLWTPWYGRVTALLGVVLFMIRMRQLLCTLENTYTNIFIRTLSKIKLLPHWFFFWSMNFLLSSYGKILYRLSHCHKVDF